MVSTKSLSLFDNMNQLTPYAVGFDRVFDRLQTTQQTIYPLQDSHLTTFVKMVTINML